MSEKLNPRSRSFKSSSRSAQGSEARLRGILDSAMDAIITVDDQERIVIFNKAAEEVFKCAVADALGSSLGRFIPARFRVAHSAHMQRFAASGITSRRMGTQRIVTGLRADGEEFPIDAAISFIEEDGRKLYTVILRDVTARLRAEAELKKSREELRELAAIANTAREQEKSRIARELHDDTAQSLTAIKMDLMWINEHLTGDPGEFAAKVADMRATIDMAVKSVRRIAADLRPLMLDDLGLMAAVESLVAGFRQRTGIACSLKVVPHDVDLADPHATAIFRTLQESLNNIAKHAQARHVEVGLQVSAAGIVLEVSDDGRGFETAAPRNAASFGLIGLRERAYLLDGETTIDSAPGKGTRIRVRLPSPAAGTS